MHGDALGDSEVRESIERPQQDTVDAVYGTVIQAQPDRLVRPGPGSERFGLFKAGGANRRHAAGITAAPSG
jgi:hypothetical protein